MELVTAMLLSIIVKGVAAIVEIITQMLITNYMGVEIYGEYTFYISVIEFFYFCVFSGSIKLNAYYLSTPETGLSDFKRKYISRFALPILAVGVLVFAVMKNWLGCVAVLILFFYYMAYDASSIFLARKKQLPALIGEYLLGRLIVLMGVLVLIKVTNATGSTLLLLYGLQYFVISVWFYFRGRKIDRGSENAKVSLRKLWEYQKSDVAMALILYSSPILQFIFGGAFSAGFTGIIALVKKFINFVTGPTAKVFLPEFSRLYKEGNREQIQKSYIMIVKLQMVFTGTAGAMLIGFPELVLKMFSKELMPYSGTFTLVAACILVIASLGPVAGLLQMTGNEKRCNLNQWISIGIMMIVWVVLRKNPLFAVYGLAVQAFSEGALQYYSVCKWFKKIIVPPVSLMLMWAPIVLTRVAAEVFDLKDSLISLIVAMIAVLLYNTVMAYRDPMVKETVNGFLKKRK